jgi:flagellar protein FlaJ
MKVAYKLFGEKLKEKRSQYAHFEKLLKSARIPKTYDLYLAEAKFWSLVAGILGIVLSFFLYPMFFQGIVSKLTRTYTPEVPTLSILPEIHISGVTIPSVSIPIDAGTVTRILFTIAMFAVLYYLTYFSFMIYPSMKADDRKRSINRMLPYAVNYMYALSKGGVGIIQIVYSLSKHKDVYGEVAEEFNFVVNLMEYFGYDFHTAMSELYDITPSDTMKEFVAGLMTTIDSGGDLTVYLAHKCEQYIEKSKSEQKSFIETLGLLAESYVTIAVTGPLFIIIIQSVMLLIGRGDIQSLHGVVYILIPLSSLFFAFIIYIISPKEVRKVKVAKKKDKKKEPKLEEEAEIYVQFKKEKAKKELYENLKSPIRAIRENPPFVLMISIPVGFIYALAFAKTIRPDVLIITAVMIALLPLAIFQEMRRIRINRIKDQVPEFLKGLASVTATGATLQQAIEIVAESGKGGLYDEVKIMKKSLDWGVDLIEAFRNLSAKLKVPTLTRVTTILVDVLMVGGDITETLHICSKDAELERRLSRERKFSMFIYLVIIYVAFFTFLGVMVVLLIKLFPQFFEASKSSTNLGFMKNKVDKDQLIWLLTQATVLQALFSGIVAGVMSEEDPASGVKHSLVMLAVILVVIVFVV